MISNLKFAVWIPFLFCAFLSAIRLLMPGDIGSPTFFAFLPLCFLFSASLQLALVKRIAMLETRLLERTSPLHDKARA